MILIGGVLMRKFKPGHKSLRRVQARGMPEAEAQENTRARQRYFQRAI